jgi:hypothetical protein
MLIARSGVLARRPRMPSNRGTPKADIGTTETTRNDGADSRPSASSPQDRAHCLLRFPQALSRVPRISLHPS